MLARQRAPLTLASLQGRPGVAVLPFAARACESRLDYLAEGIADDIIAGLSKNRLLLVTRLLPLASIVATSSQLPFNTDADRNRYLAGLATAGLASG